MTKQPYNTTIYNTALYLRLSRDDELQGESGSIQTQRMMLREYARDMASMWLMSTLMTDGREPTLTDQVFNG